MRYVLEMAKMYIHADIKQLENPSRFCENFVSNSWHKVLAKFKKESLSKVIHVIESQHRFGLSDSNRLRGANGLNSTTLVIDHTKLK